MLDVRMFGINGKEYFLTGTAQASEVLAPVESLVGLVGVPVRTDMPVPGRPGVLPGRRRYGPLETDVVFHLHADDGVQMERVYAEFRQAWSEDVPAVVRIAADHPAGAFMWNLLAAPIPGVPVDARRRTSMTVVVRVFDPVGLAYSDPHYGTGNVTLLNVGDAVVYPRFTYQGAGGVVTTPSQATFTLPPTAEQVVVDMDPRGLRLDGAFPEGVAPGDVGVWQLPEGVTAEWEYLVADPWA